MGGHRASAGNMNSRTHGLGLRLIPERFLRWWADQFWHQVFIVWAAVFVLGFIGFLTRCQDTDAPYSLCGLVYRAGQLLTLNYSLTGQPTNPWLEWAFILAPLTVFITATKALTHFFKHPLESYILRKFYQDHTVVCGLGRKGRLFVNEFRKKGERVVVIEQDGNNPVLEECRRDLVMVIIGKAEDTMLLKRANVQEAKRVICVCGDDGTNAEIAIRAQGLVRHRSGKALLCLVHIFSPQLCSLLKAKIVDMSKSDCFRLEFFNIFQAAAWTVLDTSDPFGDKGGTPIQVPHLLVIGLGWLGESLVIQAAKNWRLWYEESSTPLRITVVDKEAHRLTEYLYTRYPYLSEICRINVKSINIESREFQGAAFLTGSSGKNPVTACYVCIDNQSFALAAALTLLRKTMEMNVPVIVKLDHDRGFAALLPSLDRSKPMYTHPTSFGLYDITCNTRLLDEIASEKLARGVHEDWLKNEKAKGLTLKDKPLLKPWELLTYKKKESSRRQADDIGRKLREAGYGVRPRPDWNAEIVNFSEQEVEELAKMEHVRWYSEKTALGWTYSKFRDDTRKRHDCLLLWNKLTEETKNLDRNAVRRIPTLLADVDLDLYRLRVFH